MSEWSSRPRQTPMAGHRKATHRWCESCQQLHRTHRHALGPEPCPQEAPRGEPQGPRSPLVRVLSPPHERNPFSKAS